MAATKAMRQNAKFCSIFNATQPVQPSCEKHSFFAFPEITIVYERSLFADVKSCGLVSRCCDQVRG